MSLRAAAADRALEVSVVGAHTRIGYDVRSRLEHWRPPTDVDLTGRRFVVTGATSGIGNSIARSLGAAGATVCSASRSSERAHVVTHELRRATGNDAITIEAVDLARPADAFAFGSRLATERIDGVVHAAGAFTAEHTLTDDGIEANAAIYVLGPFALTAAVAPSLRAAPSPTLITISSSGAYAATLDVDRLEPDARSYRPLPAYAHAKRAQIALTHAWHRHFEGAVRCSAVTPGWCDTDLVREGLPRFRAFFGPVLRTPEQGADTAVWLAAHPDRTPDRLWRDRRPRLEHRLPWTARGDDPRELWQWCHARLRRFSFADHLG